MDTVVFLTTWLYGFIIVASVGFLTYVSLESWRSRPHGKFPVLCTFVSTTLLASVTMFAYMVTTSTFIVDALMYTALFHAALDVGVLWELKHLKSGCCSVEE